jgi:opacity protein-like surface antigen
MTSAFSEAAPFDCASFARSVLAAALLCSVTSLARAGDADSPAPKLEIATYFWGVSIPIESDTSKGAVSLHIPFSDVARNLNAGFMGHVRADWEDWSLVFDGLYAHLRLDNRTRTVRLGPPGGPQLSARVKTAVSLTVLESSAGHSLFALHAPLSTNPDDPRRVRGEIFAGARWYTLNPDIDVQATTPGGNIEKNIGSNASFVDGIVGLRFGIDLSKTVVFGLQGDVGGFNIGNSSEFSWSQTTTLSWRFADEWRFHMGYKFLDVHKDDAGTDVRIQLRGPLIALSYSF